MIINNEQLILCLQVEPLQSTFSVAAILGEKVIRKKSFNEEIVKRAEDGNTHLELPPTPQPSDSEEDELPRKRRCLEQCELAKVRDKLIDQALFRTALFGLYFFTMRAFKQKFDTDNGIIRYDYDTDKIHIR